MHVSRIYVMLATVSGPVRMDTALVSEEAESQTRFRVRVYIHREVTLAEVKQS
jgi:hypothetical protein